jgi:hypothetical protein
MLAYQHHDKTQSPSVLGSDAMGVALGMCSQFRTRVENNAPGIDTASHTYLSGALAVTDSQ